MNKKWLIIIGCAVILLMAGIAQFLFPRTAASPELIDLEESQTAIPVATSTNPTQATTTVSSRSDGLTISIAKNDIISSWTFKGAYSDNPELVAKAESEIKRLSDFLGTGEYPDITIYVGIANQYELLGNGRNQYDYLKRAIAAGGDTSGLPWHNIGVLMERLGALQTARIAYEKSTIVQPAIKQWHYSYLEFLTTRMKDNVADIEKEFAFAQANIGQDPDIIAIYSEWKQS